MSAGPSPSQVRYAKCKALAVAAKLFNGVRIRGGVDFTRDGEQWRARTRLIRASNGAAALLYVITHVKSGWSYETYDHWRGAYTRMKDHIDKHRSRLCSSS